ncbi:glucosaminidase domain-containing protein [Bacteroides sp. D2]|jgi:flagellum-specific peptidoglycan hydrolase FlgJ|uniref:glucosaminidase domain-containing protein n=1 Tax=Bacteroides TaxID=816 RepID=UPI0001BC7B7D|nr:glucosaminidase domain-containing protein [Bacteroides sp. D2]UWN98821.1 glucosaminidase domain-containing protein [Bacteroides sp. D2]
MRNTILIASLLMLNAQMVSAQFYTITKEAAIEAVSSKNVAVHKGEKDSLALEMGKKVANDTPADTLVKVQKCDQRVSLNQVKAKVSKKGQLRGLSELTIPNLYAEIKRHDIQHPKIVLAQAILETGWFTSPLCRNRHNLFGLTNPRTGDYYEFNHWTESVRAYYTKVQYRYKGGNYLVWLRDIGYAQDPNYIRSVIKVLKML